MFIKHGEGKIMSVVDPDELTEEQKKAAKDLQKSKHSSAVKADTSNVKKSGS